MDDSLEQKGRRETASLFLSCIAQQCRSGPQVFMIFRPALRFATRPFPPADFDARRLAAVMRPPLLFFAMCEISFLVFRYSSLARPISPVYRMVPRDAGGYSSEGWKEMYNI